MLSQHEIMDAIHDLALAGIPELQVIEEDAMPQNYRRPAWLTEYITTTRRDAGPTLVHVTQYFTVTVYVETDGYSQSSTRALLDLQEKAMNLFLPGFLRVADRAIHVSASTGGRDTDRAYVDIQMEYLDSRYVPEDLPVMEQLHTKYAVNPQQGGN